jgi:hypothetical protein
MGGAICLPSGTEPGPQHRASVTEAPRRGVLAHVRVSLALRSICLRQGVPEGRDSGTGCSASFLTSGMEHAERDEQKVDHRPASGTISPWGLEPWGSWPKLGRAVRSQRRGSCGGQCHYTVLHVHALSVRLLLAVSGDVGGLAVRQYQGRRLCSVFPCEQRRGQPGVDSRSRCRCGGGLHLG